jgi:uncharacterized protein Ymh
MAPIISTAPTDSLTSLKDLKSLSVSKQSHMLLRRLATFHPSSDNTFAKSNYKLQARDLAKGFPLHEAMEVMDLLLGAPWNMLEARDFIRGDGGGFYCITAAGYDAARSPAPVFASPEITSALELLHPDFQGYGHYFHESKLKEAVAAAFERYENRLNEIRDGSSSAVARAEAGRGLVYKLFAERVLTRPYPRLGPDTAYEDSLKGMLSGGLGWIRNPYTHEKHNLPDLKPEEALELLFVASYFMRILDLAKP